MNSLGALAQAVGAVLTAALSLLIPGGRRLRLRTSVREDLKLLTELEGHKQFGPGTQEQEDLVDRIKADVAALARVSTPKPRPKVDRQGVIIGLLMSAGFGYWTWVIAHNAHHAHHGLPWFGWLTGVLGGLGVFGMISELVEPTGGARAAPTPPEPTERDSHQGNDANLP